MFAAAGAAAVRHTQLIGPAALRVGLVASRGPAARVAASALRPLAAPVSRAALRALSASGQGRTFYGVPRRVAARRSAVATGALVPMHVRGPTQTQWQQTRYMSTMLDASTTTTTGAASGMVPPPVGTKVPPLPITRQDQMRVQQAAAPGQANGAAKARQKRLAHRATLPREPGADAGAMVRKGAHTLAYLPLNVFRTLWRGAKLTVTDPRAAGAVVKSGWGHFADEMKKYWLGTKLLAADVATTSRVMRRLVTGRQLTRRERKQLLRTTVDLLRLVPMAVFVLVPFMEILLPVALKLFPNMLPSTFQSKHEREEKVKRQLRARLRMADFLQEALHEAAEEMATREGAEQSAAELLDVIERVRRGERLPADDIAKCARVFKDELTLDHASHDQLVAMATYMGVPTFGSEGMLRYQLRAQMREIQADDKDIMWEGIENLNREELKAACQVRGMRANGLTKTQYREQLQHWLTLSVNKHIPPSLLIMSRVFMIGTESPEQALQDSIANLDEEVLTETVLDTVGGEDDVAVTDLKLKAAKKQAQRIEEEVAAEEAEATALDRTHMHVDAEKVEELLMEAPRGVDPEEILSTSELAESEPRAPQLSPEEVDTLTSLASDSGMAEERRILENLDEVRASSASGSTNRVQRYVDSLRNKLAADIEAADSIIGAKYKLLDQDQDGFVKADELYEALRGVTGSEMSDDYVWATVRQLDVDGDGLVAVDVLREAAERLVAAGELEARAMEAEERAARKARTRAREAATDSVVEA